MGLSEHGLFRGMEISSSGMSAERFRLNIIASNIANAETTQGPDGLPYRRKTVAFAPILQDMIRNADPMARAAAGVRVAGVKEDTSLGELVFRPGHPDADERGNVRMPNVNMTFEMVDLMTAMRAYEANLAAAKASKEMANKAITMGR